MIEEKTYCGKSMIKKWLEDNTYAETKSAIIHKTMDWPDEKKNYKVSVQNTRCSLSLLLHSIYYLLTDSNCVHKTKTWLI